MKTMDILVCILAIPLGGCIFSGEKPPTRDTATGTDDVSTADTGMTPDAAAPRDQGATDTRPARDLGGPDVGTPADMVVRPVDMAPDLPMAPARWVASSTFDITLGGKPTLAEPAEVASMSVGFLLGYTDVLSDRATFGWYSSDSPVALDSESFPANVPSLDVASTSQGGFATFLSTNTLYGAWFETNVNGVPFMSVTLFESTFSAANVETAAGVEADTTYTLNSWISATGVPAVEPGLVDSDGLGFLSTANLGNYDLQNLEINGGVAAAGRRLIGTGSLSGAYRLNDYLFDIAVSPAWGITEHDCGLPSTEPRIVPVRNHWALLRRPTADGDALSAVNCVPMGDPLQVQLDVIAALDGPIGDFDIAKEDVFAGAGFGVAWLIDEQAWFGELFLDPVANTATLRDAMPIVGVTGRRIRAAYNAVRQEWAVAVTTDTGSQLVILERNLEF